MSDRAMSERAMYNLWDTLGPHVPGPREEHTWTLSEAMRALRDRHVFDMFWKRVAPMVYAKRSLDEIRECPAFPDFSVDILGMKVSKAKRMCNTIAHFVKLCQELDSDDFTCHEDYVY